MQADGIWSRSHARTHESAFQVSLWLLCPMLHLPLALQQPQRSPAIHQQQWSHVAPHRTAPHCAVGLDCVSPSPCMQLAWRPDEQMKWQMALDAVPVLIRTGGLADPLRVKATDPLTARYSYAVLTIVDLKIKPVQCRVAAAVCALTSLPPIAVARASPRHIQPTRSYRPWR